MGEKEGGVFRNTCKGHMDKTKGGRIKGGSWGGLECGGVVEGKWRQLYLNNNEKER